MCGLLACVYSSVRLLVRQVANAGARVPGGSRHGPGARQGVDAALEAEHHQRQPRTAIATRKWARRSAGLSAPFLNGFYYGYMATGDREWVDRLIDWGDSVVKRGVKEPDGYIGWPKNFASEQSQAGIEGADTITDSRVGRGDVPSPAGADGRRDSQDARPEGKVRRQGRGIPSAFRADRSRNGTRAAPGARRRKAASGSFRPSGLTPRPASGPTDMNEGRPTASPCRITRRTSSPSGCSPCTT